MKRHMGKLEMYLRRSRSYYSDVKEEQEKNRNLLVELVEDVYKASIDGEMKMRIGRYLLAEIDETDKEICKCECKLNSLGSYIEAVKKGEENAQNKRDHR